MQQPPCRRILTQDILYTGWHSDVAESYVFGWPPEPSLFSDERVFLPLVNANRCRGCLELVCVDMRDCANCSEPFGLIETEGGRDRHYCNTTCRVQYYRKQQREKKRAATLQYNSELREYWHEHGVRGEVLLRLQKILLQHGKAAARAATDTVLVALRANEQAGSQEQFRLIDEILLGGEEIGFPEVRLDEFRVPQGVQRWTEFVSGTPTRMLRQMRGYLIERKQQEQHKVRGRKRLEALSHDLPHENE